MEGLGLGVKRLEGIAACFSNMQRALPKHVPPRAWKSDVSLRNPDAMARHALLAAMRLGVLLGTLL